MIIVHKCRKCGHNDLESRRSGGVHCGGDMLGGQVCCEGRCDWGPSTIIPTWSSTTFKIVPEILPPGSNCGSEQNKCYTCSCKECVALFASNPRIPV